MTERVAVDIELGLARPEAVDVENVSVEKEDEPLLDAARDEPLMVQSVVPVAMLPKPEESEEGQNNEAATTAPVVAVILPRVAGDPARTVRVGKGNLRRVSSFSALAVIAVCMLGLTVYLAFFRDLIIYKAVLMGVVAAVILAGALYKLSMLLRYPIGISMEASTVRDGVFIVEYYNKRRNESFPMSALQVCCQQC